MCKIIDMESYSWYHKQAMRKLISYVQFVRRSSRILIDKNTNSVYIIFIKTHYVDLTA